MNDNNLTRTSVLVQALTRALIALILTGAGVYYIAAGIEIPADMLNRGWALVAVFMGIDAIAKIRQMR
jgi:hypothetical protein